MAGQQNSTESHIKPDNFKTYLASQVCFSGLANHNICIKTYI